MIEFRHFILVIVKLDCRVANDGDCNFEKPLAACGYSQGRDDDLDWEQANTREKLSSDPWLPSVAASRDLLPWLSGFVPNFCISDCATILEKESKRSEEVVMDELATLRHDQGQHWVPDLTPSQGGECGIHHMAPCDACNLD
ncbi:hypothetical protein JOQ06_001233 [Pogonophryne albipinna]|uniref:MAM domain-containing protein n=1 Tax=Pogonophryne albipinna TaxID=1090488 RepID=A0AAD6B521_9TELE|nr:hypothetical protein JOQ06_001233 [Pogonophryne albipinna]